MSNYEFHTMMIARIDKMLEKIKEEEKKPNYHQMLEDILHWVENDFCFNMELKTMDNAEPYTQAEAREMAQRLAKVYGIAHAIHCESCAKKYIK